jgi:UDP-N-acetylmuramoyl-L-alanyl-D-glutamate--2,6-diaminopimelate ligase
MITFKDLLIEFKVVKGHHLLGKVIKGISRNSKNIGEDCLFIAEKGSKFDGHDFINDAIKNGVLALLVENSDQVPNHFSGIVAVVPSTRSVISTLSAHFFRFPSEQLFSVGVTGTNGKTSITYLVETILNAKNIKTGVIGTINHHLESHIWETSLTTPDPLLLQHRLHDFVTMGAQALAIEVSSHSLHQMRVEDIQFDVGIFTNLTRDHLDYHETMEKYFQAKARLFTVLLERSKKTNVAAFVNGDDPWASKIRATEKLKVFTFGQSAKNDFHFELKSMDFFRTHFLLVTPWGQTEMSIPLIGVHNIFNVMGAVGACLFKGLNLAEICAALKDFKGIPGRLHMVPNNKRKAVFVDYAHTPDALENVLSGLNKIRSDKKSRQKIITVFGCGGDRDTGKRPQMAAIAEKLSDFCIVTSDNPRTEDPSKILYEISFGFEKINFETVPDRKTAIAKALDMATPDDVVLIAGKGHESYQIVGSEKFYFDDFEIAKELLK